MRLRELATVPNAAPDNIWHENRQLQTAEGAGDQIARDPDASGATDLAIRSPLIGRGGRHRPAALHAH
jgi:hypothetical protein